MDSNRIAQLVFRRLVGSNSVWRSLLADQFIPDTQKKLRRGWSTRKERAALKHHQIEKITTQWFVDRKKVTVPLALGVREAGDCVEYSFKLNEGERAGSWTLYGVCVYFADGTVDRTKVTDQWPIIVTDKSTFKFSLAITF